MKNKIFTFIFKKFAKNVITIPPKLKSKNPVKDNKNKSSPVYNLLKSEKLAGSANEKLNIEEKLDYESILQDSSKQMLLNYYKIYEDKESKKRDLKFLCEFIQKSLNYKEMNYFLNIIKDSKRIIDSENVEKTEEVFKIFLDKIYNLSASKSK